MKLYTKKQYLLAYCTIIITGFAVLYYSVFQGLVKTWMSQEQYSFAPLIPFIFLYLLHSSRQQLLNTVIRPNYSGLIIVLIGYCLYLTGIFGVHGFTARFSCIVMLMGFTLFTLGTQMMRRLSFPFFMLLFMIPFPDLLDRLFSIKLRLFSSIITEKILHTMGVSVFRQGNIIDIGSMQFNVADACSGMNYLLPLLALSALVGYFSTKSITVRSILFVSAIPITLAANVLRITGTALIAEYWTREIAKGFMHDFSGWVVFMFAFFCLFAELKILNRLIPGKKDIPEEKRQTGQTAGTDDLKILPLATTACILLAFWGGYHAIAAKKADLPLPVMENLPKMIDGYVGKTIPEDPEIKEFSSVTDSITRIYTKEGENPVLVYIGYYRTSPKLKGFIHTPEVCLGSSGWKIKNIDYLDITVPFNDKKLRTRRIIAQRDGVNQLLIYWYQIGDFTTGNERIAHYYSGYDAILGDYSDAIKVMVSINYISSKNKNKSIFVL